MPSRTSPRSPGLTRLATLDLAGNEVADLGPLEPVDRLATLDLSGNKVESVAPLAKQTELRMLFLAGNPLSDLGPLAEAAAADAEGPKRWAPYLELYLGAVEVPDDQLAKLREAGVRVHQEGEG